MSRVIFALLLLFLAINNCQANEKDQVFITINKLFSAISQHDPKSMRETATNTFILLEHGEVWSMDDLVKVASPSEYVRSNYFHIINIDIKGDRAVASYWNKANFNNMQNSEDVIWLESAILEKINGQWLLSQMHSTRLPSGHTPKGVNFIK